MKKPDFKGIIKELPEIWHEVLLQILNTTYELGVESVDRWIPVSNPPDKTGYYIAFGKGVVSSKHYDKEKNTWNTPLGPVAYVEEYQPMPLHLRGLSFVTTQQPVQVAVSSAVAKGKKPYVPLVTGKFIKELPAVFVIKDAIALGSLLNVSTKTVYRILKLTDYIKRTNLGEYEKIKEFTEKIKAKPRGSNYDHIKKREAFVEALPVKFTSQEARNLGRRFDISGSSVYREIADKTKFHKLGSQLYAKI